MEIQDLKPDFEKLFIVFGYSEKWRHLLTKHWDDIIKGITHYDIKDNEPFKCLVQENHLQNHYNDLLFIAFKCLDLKKNDEVTDELVKNISGTYEELLQTLKFLFDYDLTEIKIVIKHKRKNLSVSINKVLRIYQIRKALLDVFINEDMYFQTGMVDPKEVKNWKGFIQFIALEKEVYERKKGRKTKHHSTGMMIYNLQKYLQLFTEMRDENCKEITRRQASFIFKFLHVFGIIKNDYSWKEDNIRLILHDFILRQRNYKIPTSMAEEIMKESEEKEKKIKGKLKEINKK